MAISSEDDGSRNSHGDRCAGCGASLPASHRYCLGCGARRGPLPAGIAKRIEALKKRGRSDGATAAATAAAAAGDEVPEGEAEEAADKWSFMPSPEIAAVAVMALLAAGVVLGSVTSPLAESAGVSPIVLEMGGSGSPSEPSEAETASAPESVAPEATASVAPEEPIVAAPEAPAAEPEATEPAPKPPPELPEEATLPEIKHVFLIVLDGHGYEEAFGKASTAPYLAETLAGEGKLLANYYAVAQGGLANEIALLSGQGPTPQTAADCPEYTAIAPGTTSVEGQVEGQGCVYPASTETLPSQLTAAKLTWRAYVEDIANGAAAGQPATCRHPVLGAADPSPAPVPGDAFETWRNPFVYFAGLTASPECAKNDVGLDRLAPDLKKAEKTPALSYIVPNACHDGSETPCAPEQPAGLPATEGFLKTVVPEIEASPAYKEEGGLIAITFDQAPQAGPAADSSSCCATPEYPNLPPVPPSTEPPATGGVKPTGGGGRVGLLLISPYVAPGTVEESAYYNHFSLLRSIEELFGFEPLGYAAEPVLTGFESGTVYDASPEESSVNPKGSAPRSAGRARPRRG